MTNLNKLSENLLVLIKSGEKEKTEDFLVEHFKEFPEEMQREIVFTFLGEAADDYLKTKLGEYLAQTAALQGLGEALEEVDKNS
jgi:hypothetical protein